MKMRFRIYHSTRRALLYKTIYVTFQFKGGRQIRQGPLGSLKILEIIEISEITEFRKFQKFQKFWKLLKGPRRIRPQICHPLRTN